MRKRLKKLLVLLLIVVVVGGVAYALCATVLRVPGGPLEESRRFIAVGERAMAVGQTRTFYVPVLRNDSGRTVKLEKIEPLRRRPGASVVGARIASRLPRGGATDVAGFPPRGGGSDLERVKDAEIEGGESARVAIGVRLTQRGTQTIRGFRVEYRDLGGIRRSVELKDRITITSRP